MIEEYKGSNAWAGVGMAGIATGMLSNYMQLDAAKDQAASYLYKADRAKIAGEAALTQSKYNNLILQERFNETQAYQAVAFAMQGRSGATIANIISRDQENLNWDKKFMELSGIITKAGHDIDSAGMRKASAETITTGYKQAAVGLLSTAAKTAAVV